MLATNRLQYQKSSARFDTVRNRRPALGLALCLFLGLAGCASAQLPATAAKQVSTQGPTPTITKATPVAIDKDARQALVDAHDAYKHRQWDALAKLVPAASQDPLLGAYAQYWLLRHQLADDNQPVPTAAVKQFLASTDNDWLSDSIRGRWIIAAARSGDYDTVNRIGSVQVSNSSIECSQLLASHMTGKKVTAAQAMAAFQPNKPCWALFDQLVPTKVLGWHDIDPLLRATLETSRKGDARRLAGYLFDSSEMKDYDAFMRHPDRWLRKQKHPKTRVQTELITLALSRLARGDRDKNAAYIRRHWEHAISKSDLQWVWGQFGLIAALRVEPDAAKWYRLSGKAPMTDYNHAWQVRSELRQKDVDWQRVRDAILKMSAKQQAEPVWVYWYGRALKDEGKTALAQKYFKSIDRDFSFYGQLANEALGRKLSIPPEPAPVTPAELTVAQSNIGLQRAIALFDLGWRHQAVPEWNFSLHGMSDRQLLAAAELARRNEIFDRVVNTSLRTEHLVDFNQRFIAPFEGQVAKKAKLINLDVAWVYGLIRQESRFMTEARSHVGAQGLMQLMPSTAKWVAKKIGMTDFDRSNINDFETNTVLGTNYLKIVLDDLGGSELLATAGYNAGPRRPMKWRSTLPGPVEGAIFAETIPFTETRLYVKHVMSNTTYYDMMFTGKPDSLKARLGTVSPEPDKTLDTP